MENKCSKPPTSQSLKCRWRVNLLLLVVALLHLSAGHLLAPRREKKTATVMLDDHLMQGGAPKIAKLV